jgi:hypothetical protein
MRDRPWERKQTTWETPRNVAILAGAIAAMAAAAGGWFGYRAGREIARPLPQTVVTLPPGWELPLPGGQKYWCAANMSEAGFTYVGPA